MSARAEVTKRMWAWRRVWKALEKQDVFVIDRAKRRKIATAVEESFRLIAKNGPKQ